MKNRTSCLFNKNRSFGVSISKKVRRNLNSFFNQRPNLTKAGLTRRQLFKKVFSIVLIGLTLKKDIAPRLSTACSKNLWNLKLHLYPPAPVLDAPRVIQATIVRIPPQTGKIKNLNFHTNFRSHRLRNCANLGVSTT